MSFDLPKRTHLVHKPVEPRNLGAKARARDIYDPKEYMWQLKYDGCNMIVVISGGQGYAFSRTGEVVTSCDHILRSLEKLPHTNVAYFGEAYSFDHIHSEINGAFRRGEPAPWMQFVIFDSVPLSDFIAGECVVPYESRYNWLTTQLDVYKPADCRYPHTFSPSRIEATESLIKTVRKTQPYELDGYVAKRKDGLWIAGAGKGGEQIKVKDHLSLDLKCVGLVEGKGKFAGMVGAVQVEYKGQVLEVGGGKLTDEQRRFYWTHRCKDRGGLLGCIVEVHALAGSTHGKLREPRFIRVRDDKTESD